MFAVLANIFNSGAVELFLQKVEFLHEIFLFFPVFPEQLESVHCSTREEQFGVCVSDVPSSPGSPHPPFLWWCWRLQMTHRNCVL